MTEEFLHYLWKFQNFSTPHFLSTEGDSVQVLNAGFHNHHAGPDFGNAKVLIGAQLWAGNVEIHVRSSDWGKHKHQHDEAYNNVILHVVYEHDEDIKNAKGNTIPTLQLKGFFDEYLYWHYEQLVQSQGFIPCENQIGQVDSIHVESMLERVLVERLTRKGKLLETLLTENNNDWEETAYQWLAYGFGLKINAEPMLWLSRQLPLRILQKHKDNPTQIEALLFGTAGLLEEGSYDEYTASLQQEFKFLRQKYGLQPFGKSVWKYGRLRPVSFPDLRLAQWSAALAANQHLFRLLIEQGQVPKLKEALKKPVSTYFETHYVLGKPSKPHSTQVSDAFLERLLINVVVPFLHLYAKMKNEPFYQQRALDLLDQLPQEKNSMVQNMETIGFKNPSAFSSQALLELKQQYCDFKKCLTCTIGNSILKQQG